MTEPRPLTCRSDNAPLEAHVDDSYGACVICHEYVPHTDAGYITVAWPCPPVRLAARRDAVSVQELARALREVLTMPVIGKYALYSYGEAASAILAAMERDRLTDAEMARAAMARPEYES
jgi:hypothetical protein